MKTDTAGDTKQIGEVLGISHSTNVSRCKTPGCENIIEPDLDSFTISSYCDGCEKRRIAEYGEEKLNRESGLRRDEWEKLCPPLYRQELDLDRIDAEAAQRVILWKYCPKGILAVGPSRTGKSRSVFWLLGRLFVKEGRTVKIFQTGDWTREVADAYGQVRAGTWHEALLSYDIVFLDDLDKLTYFVDREQVELLSLIEKRAALQKPTFGTLNMKSEEFVMAMKHDRGAALVNRLTEFFEVVEFKKRAFRWPSGLGKG